MGICPALFHVFQSPSDLLAIVFLKAPIHPVYLLLLRLRHSLVLR